MKDRLMRLRRLGITMTLGSTFLLGDCDPTIQSTVENGIINVSTALLGASLQAALQLAQEEQNQGS
jgi:hypothetical protein